MDNRPKTLSAAFVREVRDAGVFGDGRGGYGLTLRVQRRKNGRIAKTWTQRLRINGHPFNVGLGSFPLVSLAEARAAALENARAVVQGVDPRRQRVRVPSFEEAAIAAHRLHAPTWRNPKSAPLWMRSMERHVFPTIGNKRIGDVTTGDILKVVAPHLGTETGRKLRQRIGLVTKHALAEGWRTDDPAGAALNASMPKNSTAPKRHHAALPHIEVADAIAKVRASGALPATRLLFEYIILTACRSGEAREATWAEIDTKAATWTIPAERMKSGREHRVPLSTRAVEVLAEARALSDGSGLVFPSKTGKALSNMTTSKLLKETGIPATTHGFRTSFRSWCADNDESRELAEAALSHTVPGIEGSYQRSDMLERRRELMQRWADYLAA